MQNLNQRLDTMPYKGWHAKMTASVGSGVFFDAYDTQIMTVVLMALASTPIWKDQLADNLLYGLLGGAAFLGMIIGALGGGQLADRIGRVKTFAILIAIYSVALAAAGFATDIWILIITRVVSGIGLGGLVPVALSFVAEFLPITVRGRSLGIINVLFGLGGSISFLLGWALVFNNSYFYNPENFFANGWRISLWLGGIPLILAFIAWFTFPESVRWQVEKGRYEEAAKAVDALERKFTGAASVPIEDAIALEREQAAARAAAAASVPKTSFAELFKPETIRSTVVMSVFYMVLSLGTYGLGIWLPKLLGNMIGAQKAGELIASGAATPENVGEVLAQPENSLAIAQNIFLMSGIAMLSAAFIGVVAGWLADKVGRRLATLIWMTFFSVSVLLVAFFATGAALLPMLILMCCGLGAGNAMLWIFVPESFPTRVRASGVGLAGSTGRVISFLSPIALGALQTMVVDSYACAETDGACTTAATGAGSQMVFFVVAAISFVGGLAVYLFARETKDVSLAAVGAAKAK
jgi:putative MFS transporter